MSKYRNEVRIKIGNICISMVIEYAPILERVKLHYRDFISNAKPDFFIVVKYENFSKPIFDELLCRTKAWQLGKLEGNLIFYFPRKTGLSLARFNNTLNRIIFYTQDCKGQLLLYLLPELLFSSVLVKNNALMLHACGVLDCKKSYLFVAPSGGGKSTIAKLTGNKVLLNDDRIVICKNGRLFKIYGTPWHGEVDSVANKSAVINKIFFLEKADKNYILPLKTSEAMIKLMQETFALPISLDIKKKVVDLTFQISNKLSCYRFGFRPDKSMWRFLNGLAK